MESQTSMGGQRQAPQGSLMQIIMSTFHNRTTADVKQAEDMLLSQFGDKKFVDELSWILRDPQQALNIKIATANLFRKHCSSHSKLQVDHAPLIEYLYNLIMDLDVPFKAKETLSVGLQYHFNADQEDRYRLVVRDKIIRVLRSQEGVQRFGACVLMSFALMNSMVQGKQIIDFLLFMVEPLCGVAMKVQGKIGRMDLKEWLERQSQVLPQLEKFFDLFESGFERVEDEMDDWPSQMASLRQNQLLVTTLESYLMTWHNEYSMVSKNCPQTNSLKSIIMRTTGYLYRLWECPKKLFQMIFLTFLSECKTGADKQPEVESILVQAIKILESHLSRNLCLQVFLQHSTETVFTLLVYSSTTAIERQWLSDEPEQFSHLAEEYSEGSPQSDYLKVQAGNLLRTMASRIDATPRIVIQIVMLFLAGSLERHQHDSETMTSIKQEFKDLPFIHFTAVQKIEVSLSLLTVMAPYFNRVPDQSKLIYGLFLTQFQAFLKIDDPVVILRLIRTIGYYPSALYFLYIETQMNRGGVFIIEGLKSFERILRTNKFKDLFSFLGGIFTKLIKIMRITDPIMELTVINYFDQMLMQLPQLYTACLEKIKLEFRLNAANNQHAATICLNFIHALLRKESRPEMIDKVEECFGEIYGFLQRQQGAWDKYYENVIDIFTMMVNKHTFPPTMVGAFAIAALKSLPGVQKGSGLFKFYNQYFLKAYVGGTPLNSFLEVFWNQMKSRVDLFLRTTQQPHVLAYLCFLISQILCSDRQLELPNPQMKQLISLTTSLPPEFQQHPLTILFSCIYCRPTVTLKFFRQNHLLENMVMSLPNLTVQGRIPKKIFMLALIKMIEVEQNQIAAAHLLSIAITHLKAQISSIHEQLARMAPAEVRTRKLGEEARHNYEARMLDELNDNEMVNIFARFEHPINAMSEYDQLKVVFWQSDHLASALSEQSRSDLRAILETEWVGNKTRVIKRVRRQ